MSHPTFCAIIPDRGDRPKLTEFCFRQLDRMTLKPDKVYHINHEPESDAFDLVQRVYDGVKKAYEDGIEWCCVIEDDYYPKDYFALFTAQMRYPYSVIGTPTTLYYNLRNRTHMEFTHPTRSSLFNTAFRASDFIRHRIWRNTDPFVDIRLWESVNKAQKGFVLTNSFGIKHMIGKCAGKGHTMDMTHKDPDLKFLRRYLFEDNEAFDFDRSLSEELYKP